MTIGRGCVVRHTCRNGAGDVHWSGSGRDPDGGRVVFVSTDLIGLSRTLTTDVR